VRRSWLQRAGAVGAAVALLVVVASVGGCTSTQATGPAARPALARGGAGDKSALPHSGTGDKKIPPPSVLHGQIASALSELERARVVPKDDLTALTDTPGMPACAPPPVPTATYPPGSSYGVPFLAAITNGQVLAGYDEWTANNLLWKVGATTYHLYPWQSKIFDITGWVTGLLELPSLSAVIPPQDIVFCDNDGGASCLSADWPAGECIQIQAQYGPSPASKVPPPALGSYHPEGTPCIGYSTPTFSCFPYVVSLAPSGNSTLTVTGVEANGALDLQVATAAVTTVSEVPSPTESFTCQGAPASVTLSTQAGPLPATAPEPPTPPNTDDRSLQTALQPVTGPLATASSVVGSNDFAVPAFFPNASGSPCSLFLADSLNTYAVGWNDVFKDQGEGKYYVDGGTNPISAQPGWAQFTATTTVVSLGLPEGPPPGFSL
jgi:hypothetical protein